MGPVLFNNNKYINQTRTNYNTNQLGADNKNKLLLLYETNIVTPTYSESDTGLASLAFKNNLRDFGISPDPTLLLQYRGGPNAIAGGKTSIRKDTLFNTSEGFKRNAKFEGKTNQFLVYTPDLIINKLGLDNWQRTHNSGQLSTNKNLLKKSWRRQAFANDVAASVYSERIASHPNMSTSADSEIVVVH